MSTNLAKEINCPNCGRPSSTRMWPEIDRAMNPDQRERILEESLFVWDCPNCGYEMQLMYPCLYHDGEKKLLLLLDPNPMEQSVDKKTLSAAAPGVQKRVVGTVEELKEKILIFENDLNDAACELAKLAMAQSVEHRTGLTVAAGYFSSADPEQNEITFVFCFEDHNAEPLYQTTRYDVYRKTEEIVETLHFDGAGGDFLRVDADMARMMLEAYQNL